MPYSLLQEEEEERMKGGGGGRSEDRGGESRRGRVSNQPTVRPADDGHSLKVQVSHLAGCPVQTTHLVPYLHTPHVALEGTRLIILHGIALHVAVILLIY